MKRSGHVVFVINSLVGGGAERALINVIGGLEAALRNYRVSLVVLDDLPAKHTVPAFVEAIVLDSRESTRRSLQLFTRQMRLLKPDVVVSFLSRANCANVFAAKLLGYASIISERVNTTSHLGSGAKGRALKLLTRLFYQRADLVIAVSTGVENDLVAHFGIDPDKVRVIQNPIDMSKLEGLSKIENANAPSEPYVIALGRLVPNKNFGMLLSGFAKSRSTDTLMILGEGPERAALEKLVVDLGIADRVRMPGYVDNPYPLVAGARYLVSTSNAEGFPNAIVEAMALGCPVIATDCESGPADVLSPSMRPSADAVTQGEFGVLVPVGRDDVLAEAIAFYRDDAIRTAYRDRGRMRAASFAPDQICGRYWHAIAPFLPTSPGDAAPAIEAGLAARQSGGT